MYANEPPKINQRIIKIPKTNNIQQYSACNSIQHIGENIKNVNVETTSLKRKIYP